MMTETDPPGIVAAGRHREPDTRYRVGVYGWTPGEGGVHYFRIAEPLRVLAEHGNRSFHGIELDDVILDQVDTVLAHTLHTPDASEAWQKLAALGSHRLVLDVDDAMWSPDWTPFRNSFTADALKLLYRNVSAAHVVTTPSPVIAEHLVKYNPNVWIVPNTVPAWLLTHNAPPRDRPMIGYQGSSHHIRDWTPSQQLQLARFFESYPQWGLHTYGPLRVTGSRDGLLHTPWLDGVEKYWQAASFDVGIGPLRPTKFNRSKSGLRAIEYAAMGVVAVLPDLDPYREWIQDGITGRLVRSHQTLSGVLRDVAGDTTHRRTMAANARQAAASWTTEAAIERWTEAWHSR